MAQLVARLVRNEKVGGSNPPSSTTGRHPMRMSVFCMPGVVLRCLLLWCFVAAGVPGAGSSACGLGRCVCWWAAARPLEKPHASLTARSGRSRGPPWPCRRPPAPRPGPPVPPAPFTPAAPARCVVSTSGQAPPPPTGAAGWPSGCSGALHTCGPGRWRVLGASTRCPVVLLSLALTHVKPSTPLLACALSSVKPTTPLHARYTHFWCYFIDKGVVGFIPAS